MIHLEDVHLQLQSRAGPVDILRGVDLDVATGDAVAVLGPSGSGKSTLLMIIAGLERPSKGKVCVAGSDMGALDEDGLALVRRHHVGIVFQSFHLVAAMTGDKTAKEAMDDTAKSWRKHLKKKGEDKMIGLINAAKSGWSTVIDKA